MSVKNAAIALAAVSLVSLAGGGALAYWAMKKYGPQPEVVTPEVAVEQPTTSESPHGSVILERKPNKKPQKAPHIIPRKAVEERRVSVTVQPTDETCPPVTVNLSTVRQGDGRRVIASSPDGKVIKSLDIPIEKALMPPKPLLWAAGVSYGLAGDSPGLWVERDLGKRVVVGADVYGLENSGGMELRVRVGVRF